MLASMFVLTPFGIAVVTLFATAAAFTVMATRRIVLVNGAARFGGDWRNVDSAMRTGDVAVYALVAAPIVVAAVWRSVELRRARMGPGDSRRARGNRIGGWIDPGCLAAECLAC